ncbi:MAG: ATP-binding protein [Acidobacteriota bacterium]
MTLLRASRTPQRHRRQRRRRPSLRSSLWCASCAFLLSLLHPLEPARAQAPTTPQGALSIDSWDAADQLPQNIVLHLAQDSEDYLWIGTQEGIAHFDGYRFTAFDKRNTTQFRDHVIEGLASDPEGGVWIATATDLIFYRNHRFSSVDLAELGNGRLAHVAVDALGEVWVATSQGLCTVRRESLGLACPQALQLPVSAEINRVRGDDSGTLWLATAEGLISYHRELGFRVWGEETDLSGTSILGTANVGDEVWLATLGRGIYVLKDGEVTAPPEALQDLDSIVFDIEVADDGTVWFATRNGLSSFDGETLHRIGVEQGLTASTVLCLRHDRLGDLWIGTNKGGLNRLRRGSDPSLPDIPVPRIESIQVGQSQLFADAGTLRPEHPGDLEIHYTAVDLRYPDEVVFRYLLDGRDQYWTESGNRRVARYTGLDPGQYTFRVRATNPRIKTDDGELEAREASLVIVIPPRFYETQAFRGTAFLMLLAMIRYVFVLRTRRILNRQQHLEQLVDERTREVHLSKESIAQSHQRLEKAHSQLTRTNQELQALNREKSEFLAIATHDLRAPLVNLRGFSGELRYALDDGRRALDRAWDRIDPNVARQLTSDLDESLPEALSFIDTSADRMERLIQPILKLSRLTRRELEPTELAVAPIVRRVLADFEAVVIDRKITVLVGRLPTIRADRAAIDEVFRQLLDNAISYLSLNRPGRIEIISRETENEFMFHIRDNGRGIPETHRKKVFGIFGRVGLDDQPGKGMGLVYVRTLIQRHGGRVWFDSELNGGTEFSFSIPK